MEMGIPGLPPCSVGVEAQIEALKKGVAAIYPDIEGIPALKQEAARFVKNFIDLEVDPENCIPTVGSMMGGMAGFMTFVRCRKERDTTLFIDPGFPVQKQQHRVMGLKYETFDVYEHRGAKLRAKLESYLEKGNIHTIMYSNPNNPSWICFTEEELQIIGDMANKYDVFVFEDLAYFGMDFRQNISAPGIPPYQPSVGKYTDNYALLISGSKAFSYAGERIALMIMSKKLYNREFDDLEPYFRMKKLGRAIIYGTVYAISSGVAHSAQYALAAILKGCNDGTYNYIEDVKEYGEKAAIMKKMFLDNGIQPVHENCMNYGGMGWPFTLKLLENVPGLKLVFDTGNPVFTLDKSKPKPYPQESSWEFYEHVRDHIVYVHIKDGTYDVATKKTTYTWPGEGDGDVKKIVADLIKNGYDGGFSMEPHMQLVFHDSAVTAQTQAMYDNYVEYGRRFMKIVEDCKKGM